MEDKPDGRMCVRCRTVKPESEFYKAGSGLDSSCKPCRLEQQKEAKRAQRKKPVESKKATPQRVSEKPKPATNPMQARPGVDQILSFFAPEVRNALIDDCRRQAVKEIITFLQASFL